MLALEYLFYLNGDHEKLARLEIISLLRSYGLRHEIKYKAQQTLIVSSEAADNPIFSRLALTHRVMQYLGGISPNDGEIDWGKVRLQPKGSFSFRIRKIDKDINSMDEERRISEQIISHLDSKVDLTSPDQEFYGVYVNGMIHVGLTLFANDPKTFSSRKPQYRPYFHPSSIDPRLARAMVNISEARKEVLDPFCGTGGILIEAALMGLEVHGIDIEEKMVGGTRLNLLHYGLEGDIIQADSSKLDEGLKFETIVTDVPYGKSTVIGQDRDDLYRQTFERLFKICEKKAVVVTPMEHDFTKYGFIIEDMIEVRVHKSLVRRIYKLKKPLWDKP